jgi:hypothetical protein
VTPPEAVWQRHNIPEIGLSFEIDPTRALETFPLDDGAIVSQRFPGDAVVFVRYGADQTPDRFLAGLGDYLTTATTLADEPVTIAGRPARRLTVSLHRRGKQIPSRPTYRPQRIQVTGFSIRDTLVLVGYRLPEDSSDEVRAVVERFVDGVRATGNAGDG